MDKEVEALTGGAAGSAGTVQFKTQSSVWHHLLILPLPLHWKQLGSARRVHVTGALEIVTIPMTRMSCHGWGLFTSLELCVRPFSSLALIVYPSLCFPFSN